MRCADLSCAELRCAALRSAELLSAEFAELRSAEWRSAELLSAELSSADVHSADLRSGGECLLDVWSGGGSGNGCGNGRGARFCRAFGSFLFVGGESTEPRLTLRRSGDTEASSFAASSNSSLEELASIVLLPLLPRCSLVLSESDSSSLIDVGAQLRR